MKINNVTIAGIIFLAVSAICFITAISLQSQMFSIVEAIQQSKLSADSQVEALNNFNNIASLSFLGGWLFLIIGSFGMIFGYSIRSKPQ